MTKLTSFGPPPSTPPEPVVKLKQNGKRNLERGRPKKEVPFVEPKVQKVTKQLVRPNESKVKMHPRFNEAGGHVSESYKSQSGAEYGSFIKLS